MCLNAWKQNVASVHSGKKVQHLSGPIALAAQEMDAVDHQALGRRPIRCADLLKHTCAGGEIRPLPHHRHEPVVLGHVEGRVGQQREPQRLPEEFARGCLAALTKPAETASTPNRFAIAWCSISFGKMAIPPSANSMYFG